MAERRVEIESRLGSMSELQEILGAMQGIAAARVQQGAATLVAVRSFADTVYGALDQILALRPPASGRDERERGVTRAVVVFTTEHGFVAGLNDDILREAARAPTPHDVFLVGTRGGTTAAETGFRATTIGPMSLHLAGIGEVADRTLDALLRRFNGGGVDTIDVVAARQADNGQIIVDRRTLLPLQRPPLAAGLAASAVLPPVSNLPADRLLPHLIEEYLYACFVEIAAQSLVAESSARLAVLASAHAHLDDMLESLRGADHRLRQEEITAEVLELVGGRSHAQPI